MALTSATLVRNRLGIDDDATARPAITIASNVSVTITVTGTGLSMSPALNGPYTFSNANADTIQDVAALLNANDDLSAEVVDAGVSSLASTLLDAGSYVINMGLEPVTEILTYTPEQDNTNSTLIGTLITETDAAIGRFCNRIDSTGTVTFESASRTEKYDGNGQPVLVLRNAPVTAITSVSLVDSDGTVTALSSDSYTADLVNGRLHWNSSVGTNWFAMGYDSPADIGARGRTGWPRGFQNIQVVYTAGYATVPGDLQGVATDIVVEAYLNRRRNMALASDGAGSRSVSYRSVEEMVRARQAQLAPFVRNGRV